MKYLNKKGFLAVGLLSLMFFASEDIIAQSVNSVATSPISGVVTDAALGTPMVGVRVQAYNNPLYTAMTKEDGSYTIMVPDFVSSLTFSLEGCNTNVCAIRGRSSGVDVILYSDNFSKEYSPSTVASKSKVSEIKSMNVDMIGDTQIQQSLMGDLYATGRSGQIGVGSYFLVNGVNSLNINTQPLIVLDGVIVEMGYTNESLHDGFYNNLLANIMVDDIESVSVLKNGLAIYGPKGANGVILIDTKRNKSMATKIDLSLGVNYQLLPKLTPVMDASQYRSYVSELLGTTGTKLSNFKFLQPNPEYYYYNQYHNETDWSKTVYDEAVIQSYSVNVQGGDEVANYNLSVGYAFGDATLVNNNFSRFNIRLNSDIILSDKMDLRFDAAYSDVTRDLRDDGSIDNIDNSLITSPGYLSLIKAPFLSPYAFDVFGNKSSYLAGSDDYLSEVFGTYEESLSNPLALIVNGEGINKNYFGNRLITLSVTPKYEFSRYLSLSEHFSYILANADENYYLPNLGTAQTEIEGLGIVRNRVSAMDSQLDGFMSNTYLNYARRFTAHNVKLKGGFRYSNNHSTQSTKTGYNSGNDKTPNMSRSLMFPTTSGVESQEITMTYWAQGDYNYKERYYLSAGLSLAASSRFGGNVSNGVRMFNVPWGLFPSIQGAWVASSESWFNVPFIDYLKVDAGFDLTGNDGFDDSAARTYFSSIKILELTGLVMSNIGNNSLQWETTKKLTAGIDLSMLNNRLAVSFNMYHNDTDNLLSIGTLSYLTGVETSWTNGGSIKNNGFDLSVTGKILNKRDIKWEAGLSVGHYKTEVTALPGGKGYTTQLYGANVRTEIGSSAGYFLGYKTDGVYSTSKEASDDGKYMLTTTGARSYFGAGDMKFVDIITKEGESEGLINENDMVRLGDPNPDFYGRIFTSLNYKAFTLSATFNYSLGNDVYNYQRMLLESGSRFNNQSLAMTNRWISENQVTNIPKISYEDPMQNARFSDRWIEDGSYLRLKNVTLSYKLPVRNAYIQGLTVWGSANNLWTLTNYLGSDPEFSASNSIYSLGIDRGLLPQSTNFSLGVKINL